MSRLGARVLYTVGESEAKQLNERRRHQTHNGNRVNEGDVFPAIIVNDFGGCANLHVFLDGDDAYWPTSRAEGEGPGFWQVQD